MTVADLGKLFLTVWCTATERPYWESGDSNKRENRDLLAAHPLIAAVCFAAAGICTGLILAVWGGVLTLFLPEAGGAVVFALSGVLMWEYISGWRSTAIIAKFIQNRVEYGSWCRAVADLSGSFCTVNSTVGTLTAAVCIAVKIAGFMSIYFSGSIALVIIFAVFPFAQQGLLAHLDGEDGKPVLGGGISGQGYLLGVVLLVLFCGVAAAPAALAVAALCCWINYEITSRTCRDAFGFVPLNCITLAGSIAEVSSMFAALILIG